MSFTVNASKSGLQNLYDLLNNSTPGKGFSTGNITFGVPDPRSGAGDNTLINIAALSNKGYKDSIDKTYTRLNPGSAHNKTGSLKVLIAPTDSQQQIRDKVTAAVGCIPTDVEVTGNGVGGAFKIPEHEDDTSCSFTLTSKPGSYVYVGTFTALLTVPDVDIPLSEVIRVNSLGGFTAG